MEKLAPPGAGLPLPELFVARMRFAIKRWKTSDQSALEQFQQISSEILQVTSQYDPEEASRQVLIKRLRGLEDSSRNWSIFMTLEHLRIVNDVVTNLCQLLSRGETPAEPASTAAVKPSSSTGSDVVQKFDDGCKRFVQSISSIETLKTATKFAHPWFGPMDASGWVHLAPFHMGLHLNQIRHIGKKLS